MRNVKCFISDSHNPFLNIAIEEWLFNSFHKYEHILYLWRNKDTVIIGRNQNPWAECNLKKMEAEGVSLVRRHSGGGAVFQDLGNSIFTFISHKGNFNKEKNYEIIINALKRYDIQATLSGRNDIVVDSKKISGNAYKESNSRVLHHGTLLLDVNLSRLANYLTPSQKKLNAKGTGSVKARVANLIEFNPRITHDSLMNSIIDEFFLFHGVINKNIENLKTDKVFTIPEIKQHYDFLISDKWRFDETHEFDHHMEQKLSWGILNVNMNTKNGRITKIKIYSDSLYPDLIKLLTDSLHEVSYSPEVIKEQMINAQLIEPKFTSQIQEFSNWIVNEI